jgi:hypothetical protein
MQTITRAWSLNRSKRSHSSQLMGTLASMAAVVSLTAALGSSRALAADANLAFKADDQGNLGFNTGVVKGSLKKDGLGAGLKPITFIEPNVPIDNNHGLLVPYRFLTPQKRYGFGSWEWPRTGKLLNDGGAELRWAAAADRPFTFSSTLRWKAADTVDLTLIFTPETDLEKFELFLGSYFRKFTVAKAYVKDAGNGQPGFVDSPKDKGEMQLFPSNPEVLAIIKDGRWKFPPYPNNWAFRPDLAAPLGIKQEPTSGVTVLIMAPPEDCFALSVSQQEAGLGAFYLSLFGKDVKKGQSLTGHARLIFGRNTSDEQALQKYRDYLKDLKR